MTKKNNNKKYDLYRRHPDGVGVPINRDEADDAESKKDFKHKIGIVKKESRETKHFIRMIAVAVPELKSEAQLLWKEAKELNLIFNSIYRKVM